MNKSTECEYRGPADGVSEAIRRKGVQPTVCSCSRPGVNNTDRVCDFTEICNSSECPKILYDCGKIDMDELLVRMFGA